MKPSLGWRAMFFAKLGPGNAVLHPASKHTVCIARPTPRAPPSFPRATVWTSATRFPLRHFHAATPGTIQPEKEPHTMRPSSLFPPFVCLRGLLIQLLCLYCPAR